MAKVLYEKDANPEVLKNRKVAILGYGSQGHAQALASGAQAGGEGAILAGRSRIPGRVVVPGQGGGCAEAEGFAEELAGADEAGGGGAVGQQTVGEQFALGVEGQHPEALLDPVLAT